jgi:AcrR family transcriptional regulator
LCQNDVVIAGGLRERKKEQTRDALVRAALRLFAKRGFDQVTVEEIAASCDVSPRTFFRYFASKEDVLFAEGDRYRLRLMESLAEQGPNVVAFDALEIAMRDVAGEFAGERDTKKVRHRIVMATPSLQTRATERQQGWERDMAELLRSSGRAKRMSDIDLRLLVAATTTAFRVACDAWLEHDSADLNTVLRAAFARLRGGFAR